MDQEDVDRVAQEDVDQAAQGIRDQEVVVGQGMGHQGVEEAQGVAQEEEAVLAVKKRSTI